MLCFYALRPWRARAREVRAAWRALFLPDAEGAGDGAGQ